MIWYGRALKAEDSHRYRREGRSEKSGATETRRHLEYRSWKRGYFGAEELAELTNSYAQILLDSRFLLLASGYFPWARISGR